MAPGVWPTTTEVRSHASLKGHTPLTFAGGHMVARAELNNVSQVSPTAGTWSSSQWRPDNEFETDRRSGALRVNVRDPCEAFNVRAAKRIATRRQQVKGTVLVLANLDGRRPRLVATKDAHGIWTDTAETS